MSKSETGVPWTTTWVMELYYKPPAFSRKTNEAPAEGGRLAKAGVSF
jgi:hypothetical protein